MSSASDSAATPGPRDLFATTRWAVVLSAGRESSPQAAVALEDLCRTYWYPLYVFVRHQGRSREDAEDLVQSFFARFLERNYLGHLRSDQGKFRAFLLASLKHFLANEWDRARRQKRGGGTAPLSLDWQDADTRYRLEAAGATGPDRSYDRQWAVTLLERVLTRLRDENLAQGKGPLFERFRPFLALGLGAIPYAEAAGELGLTPGAARVTVHRLRRRYRELLREEIARTLIEPAQVDEELSALFGAFAD